MMYCSLIVIVNCLTLIGIGYSQSTLQPVATNTPISLTTSGSSFDGYNVCLSIVDSALQTLNVTFELQSSTMNQPFDLSLLSADCFYFKSPATTCQQLPSGLRDMFSMMLWVTQLIQLCDIPASWVGYPETINNINQGVRQFSASLGTSSSTGSAGSLGVSGSVGNNGLGMGTNGQMGSLGSYGQGSGMIMVPIQSGASISAVPPNPFSTMMSIIGSSVGPQGITISPATIAGILSLINQVVGIAVQLAPIGGAVAGPLLAGAMG